MSGFLDTSMVVRYLTGDPPELAERAAQIIDHQDGLWITDVALVETAYVLTAIYQVPRRIVVDHLIAFVQKENITPAVLDKGAVLQALLLCKSSRHVSFVDAMVWAAARAAGSRIIYTLDARFPSDGCELQPTAS